MTKRQIMNAADIDRALNRIAHEIVDRNNGGSELAIVGIRTRGVFLAERLTEKIRRIEDEEILMGIIDITLYRDDLKTSPFQPEVRKTEIPFSVTKKNIILVDDVLYTGRTIRAAIDALIDLGRPNGIQLAVLVDRGFRELPIQADFVGREVSTLKNEEVEVLLSEKDGEDKVEVNHQ